MDVFEPHPDLDEPVDDLLLRKEEPLPLFTLLADATEQVALLAVRRNDAQVAFGQEALLVDQSINKSINPSEKMTPRMGGRRRKTPR